MKTYGGRAAAQGARLLADLGYQSTGRSPRAYGAPHQTGEAPHGRRAAIRDAEVAGTKVKTPYDD